MWGCVAQSLFSLGDVRGGRFRDGDQSGVQKCIEFFFGFCGTLFHAKIVLRMENCSESGSTERVYEERARVVWCHAAVLGVGPFCSSCQACADVVVVVDYPLALRRQSIECGVFVSSSKEMKGETKKKRVEIRDTHIPLPPI